MKSFVIPQLQILSGMIEYRDIYALFLKAKSGDKYGESREEHLLLGNFALRLA
ncbi:MAG: hypothetical protein VYA34_12465 [Myxococcota bacterium]|nr:hypothetical protein [Myxococcota bacterium]